MAALKCERCDELLEIYRAALARLADGAKRLAEVSISHEMGAFWRIWQEVHPTQPAVRANPKISATSFGNASRLIPDRVACIRMFCRCPRANSGGRQDRPNDKGSLAGPIWVLVVCTMHYANRAHCSAPRSN